MTAHIIQATTPPHPDDHLPALRYWNATTGRWEDYQHATVYDTDNLTCPQGPRASSTTQIIQPYPIDADGYPYRVDDVLGPVRMTHCCGAATSCDDTTSYCKSCHRPTSADYESPARPAAQRRRTTDDTPERGSPVVPGASVGDPVLGKSRMLSRQCATCIFKPGNPMHLQEGRLRDLLAETLAAGTYVVCHSTLPHYLYPNAQPAICRGFADGYTSQALQVIGRLWGFIEVDPPGEQPESAQADTANEPPRP
ncbi:hypothetical protein EDC02_5000 [Micromonospora sp. Llam0]|uniref:hypothetical protein n=1 Tax=Micromonospora sp. Llam0 TaxID=2485143 RepID=UPI000FB566CD|nr:hypothetical protein [Micromonospora sp. Llam0]ROO62991.1 hypothetical protein EDC02_5000 [Micromonospora sp. Llam0]